MCIRDSKYYKYHKAYHNGTAYITIGNEPSFVIRVDNTGKITDKVVCS